MAVMFRGLKLLSGSAHVPDKRQVPFLLVGTESSLDSVNSSLCHLCSVTWFISSKESDCVFMPFQGMFYMVLFTYSSIWI